MYELLYTETDNSGRIFRLIFENNVLYMQQCRVDNGSMYEVGRIVLTLKNANTTLRHLEQLFSKVKDLVVTIEPFRTHGFYTFYTYEHGVFVRMDTNYTNDISKVKQTKILADLLKKAVEYEDSDD